MEASSVVIVWNCHKASMGVCIEEELVGVEPLISLLRCVRGSLSK